MGVSWLPSLTDRRVPLRELGMKSEDPALLGCDLGRILKPLRDAASSTLRKAVGKSNRNNT